MECTGNHSKQWSDPGAHTTPPLSPDLRMMSYVLLVIGKSFILGVQYIASVVNVCNVGTAEVRQTHYSTEGTIAGDIYQ